MAKATFMSDLYGIPYLQTSVYGDGGETWPFSRFRDNPMCIFKLNVLAVCMRKKLLAFYKKNTKRKIVGAVFYKFYAQLYSVKSLVSINIQRLLK